MGEDRRGDASSQENAAAGPPQPRVQDAGGAVRALAAGGQSDQAHVPPVPEHCAGALDECDVLQLHLSATNPTGYKGVYVKRGTGRFEAKVCSHGQLHHIGNFDTALEAAEAYARHVQTLESA